MPNMENRNLFPRKEKKKGFGDLIEVVDGTSNQATLRTLGMEIAFGWRTIEGKRVLKEISRSKEGNPSPGSMDIPKGLYNALKNKAAAVIESHAETKRNAAAKQQLKNKIKEQQPDLF